MATDDQSMATHGETEPQEKTVPDTLRQDINDGVRALTESGSSDSEEEGCSAGYVLLPQDEGEELQTDWSVRGEEFTQQSVDDTKDTGSSSEGAVGTSQPLSRSEGAVGTSQPLSRSEDTQVEAIKQAMAGFSLPSSVMPDWAKVVPEDIWKAELIGGLKKKKQGKRK